jgi:hypothetical protein
VDPVDPVNINRVKTQLKDYQAGNYDYDVAAVLADARIYLERRLMEPVTLPAVVLDIVRPRSPIGRTSKLTISAPFRTSPANRPPRMVPAASTIGSSQAKRRRSTPP